MKVICIDGVVIGQLSIRGRTICVKGLEIYQLEIYTICKDRINRHGERCVTLMERSSNVWYLRSRFIPVSDIDETELVGEVEKEVK